MSKKGLTAYLLGVICLVVLGTGSSTFSAEKLRWSTVLRNHPVYYLPTIAAADKGFWKKNGLDVKWTAFRGTVNQTQGIVAGDVDVAADLAEGVIQAATRKVPVIMVGEFHRKSHWVMWVPTKSPRKSPKDLKGAKIGVSRLGGSDWSTSRMIVRSLGLEKDVKIVGTGCFTCPVAMLKAGSIDATLRSYFAFMELKVQGEMRELIIGENYHPKEWASDVIVTTRDFLKRNPDKVRRAIKAVLQSTQFIGRNSEWAVDKLKGEPRYSDKAAREIVKIMAFSRDGKINRRGVENVRRYLIDFDVINKEKATPVSKLFTNEFIR